MIRIIKRFFRDMITDYSSLTKDDLLKEINARKDAGRTFDVKASSTKDELVKALQDDDEAAAKEKDDVKDKDATVDLSRQGITATHVPKESPTQPKPEEFRGRYKHISDGLVYELAPLLPELGGGERDVKTHRLRVPPQLNDAGAVVHPGLYWEGSKKEFKDTFDKI